MPPRSADSLWYRVLVRRWEGMPTGLAILSQLTCGLCPYRSTTAKAAHCIVSTRSTIRLIKPQSAASIRVGNLPRLVACYRRVISAGPLTPWMERAPLTELVHRAGHAHVKLATLTSDNLLTR